MRTPEEADAQVPGLAGRLAGMRVFVNGLGITGPPVARLLAARGALVTAADGRDDEANRRAAKELAGLGIPVTFTEHPALPPGTDLVITEKMMITNRPPRITSSSWVFVHTASPASTPPSASDPVSPMKILAGGAFHHRNPKHAPSTVPATTAMSSGSRTA